MLRLNPRASTAGKLLLAAVLIAMVLGVAGTNAAPSVPLRTWVLWCALGLGAFVLVSVLSVLLNLQLGQWALRKGGTDAQWFWFTSEPPGLVALREQKRATDKKAQK